jgi:hypothetical protein
LEGVWQLFLSDHYHQNFDHKKLIALHTPWPMVYIFSHTPRDPSIDTRQELKQAMREAITEMERVRLKGNTDQTLRLVGVLATDT